MPVTPASVSATKADSARYAQFEIFRAQREVHDAVLLFGTDGEPIQAADRRQDVQPRDAPLGRVGRFAEYPDEPRADPRISAELGQHVDVDVVREPFRDAGDLGAQPLLHDSPRDAVLEPFLVELGAGVCAGRDQRGVSARIARREHALDLAQDTGDAVVGRRNSLGVRRRRHDKREREQEHPHRSIRPRTGLT